MNTDSNLSQELNNSPAELDQQILGAYVEYEAKDPCLPNGIYVDRITSAIPVVVPLTYRRMVDEMLYGCALVMEHDVTARFKAAAERDPRLKHLRVEIDEWDEGEDWVSLVPKDDKRAQTPSDNA